jgi:predicted dehydrogenase
MSETIRVGIVGAGTNTRSRHIPGLKQQEGVKIVSVCNRSQDSSERVAAEFGIPNIHRHWKELVISPDIDAVVIGTWPYLHCCATTAALEAGKHVLTEARMATNAREAHLMLEKSLINPQLVTQVVPSPVTLRVDRTVQQLLAEGYMGELYALDLKVNTSAFADSESSLHWRQDHNLSGLNILTMGIWYEAILRWIGEAKSVTAMTRVNVKQRKDTDGVLKTVLVPDHVDVVADMASGAQAHYQFSAVTGLGPDPELWLFGSQGTLRYDVSRDKLFGGKRGDTALKEICIPPELEGRWRVEEEFINAIRGKEKVRLTTFEDGVKYMQFTEAVARSASAGTTISVSEM